MFEYVCFLAVKWQGGDVRLIIYYDFGFIFYIVVFSEGSEFFIFIFIIVVWLYFYEKLRMIGDDGYRFLWLEFFDGLEQVYFDEFFFFFKFDYVLFIV